MPIVKHIAIHKHPFSLIKYILNGDKNDEMKYVTGLNCSADVQGAYDEFKSVFENFSGVRFYKESLENADDEKLNSKEKVRLHHYIQSFAPGEVTPEEAHRIGVEWAKKIFGDKHQVLVSTHIDKGHIHNHFAIAAYSLDGKLWYGNKKTLAHCRSVSDKIAREHGLSVIEKPKYSADHKYSDWLAKQSGTSWKSKLCDDIDRLVLSEDVKSINDLAEQLRQKGYEVRLGKYLSIKAVKNRKAMRSYRLGDGYAVEELAYRIANKDREMSIEKAESYDGIQKQYALCLRQLQISVYRKEENPYRIGYQTLRKNAELLTYLCEKNISSLSDFENAVNSVAEKTAELKNREKELEQKIKNEEKIISDIPKFLELNKKKMLRPDEIKILREIKYLTELNISSEEDIENHKTVLEQLKTELEKTEKELSAADNEKREAAENYKTYLRQTESDYDRILRKIKEEQEKAEDIREQQSEQQQEENYRNGNAR